MKGDPLFGEGFCPPPRPGIIPGGIEPGGIGLEGAIPGKPNPGKPVPGGIMPVGGIWESSYVSSKGGFLEDPPLALCLPLWRTQA